MDCKIRGIGEWDVAWDGWMGRGWSVECEVGGCKIVEGVRLWRMYDLSRFEILVGSRS